MAKGWHDDPYEHALAARGIRTRGIDIQTTREDSREWREIDNQLSEAADEFIREKHRWFLEIKGEQIPDDEEFRYWFLSFIDTTGEGEVLKKMDPMYLEGKCSSCMHKKARSAILTEMIRMGLFTFDEIIHMSETWKWDYKPATGPQDVGIRSYEEEMH